MAVYPGDYPVLIRVQPQIEEKAKLAAAPAASADRGAARQDDVVYFSLKPVWFAMQAVGFYPMHRKCRGGQTKGRASNAWAALNALQYAVVLAVMSLSFAAAMNRAQEEEEDFDGTIIRYLVYIQCVMPAVLLPLYALQRVDLGQYLLEWNRLQVEFASQSGRAMSSLRPFSSRDSLEMLVVVVLWEVVVAGCQLALHPPIVVLALVLSNAVAALLTCLWYLNGRLLRSAARACADHLATVLRRPVASAAQVDECRLQTLRLVSLCTGAGSALTLCLGFLLLLHFVLLTLTLYALFGQLTHSTRSNARLPSLVAGVVFSGTVLYVVCDTGHRVARAVKTGSMLEIMAFRKRTPLMGEDLHSMIETFIATVHEVPSDVSLSGVTVINRGLFTAVLSTMVTYLVVVVQFRISLEAKEEEDAAAAEAIRGAATTMASVASSLAADDAAASAYPYSSTTLGVDNATAAALVTALAAAMETAASSAP